MNTASIDASNIRVGLDLMAKTLRDAEAKRVVIVRDVADGRHRHAAGALRDQGFNVWFSPLGAPSPDKLATLLPAAGSRYDAAVLRVYDDPACWARLDVALRWASQRLGPCATPRALVLFTNCPDALFEQVDAAGLGWWQVGRLHDRPPADVPPAQTEPPAAYTRERLLRELREHLLGPWLVHRGPLQSPDDESWTSVGMESHGVYWSAVVDAGEPGVLLTAIVGDAEFDSSDIEHATVHHALVAVRNKAVKAARLVCGLVGEAAPAIASSLPGAAPHQGASQAGT